MDALLKTLSGSYPAMQAGAARLGRPAAGGPVRALWRGEVAGLLRVRWPLHLLRGVLNVAMLALFAYALRELGLAEAYTPFFIAPLLITALSTVVLREKVRAAHWWRSRWAWPACWWRCGPARRLSSPWARWRRWARATGYAVSATGACSRAPTQRQPGVLDHRAACAGRRGAGLAELGGRGAGALAAGGGAGGDGLPGAVEITEAFRHGQASVVAPFEYTALAWGMGLDWVLRQAVPGLPTLLGLQKPP